VLTKGKSSSKRKPPAVLVVEPEQKYHHQGEGSASGKRGERPFCVFHNMNSHNTKDYFELKKLGEEAKRSAGVAREPTAATDASVTVAAAEAADATTTTLAKRRTTTTTTRGG
jgi:hypothetical protein